METLKEVLLTVLKYLLLLLGLAVLTGYLAVKDRLPAVVPEPAALWIKERTLALMERWSLRRPPDTTAPRPAGQPQEHREAAKTMRGVPWTYRVWDRLLLEGRADRCLAVAEFNRRKAAEVLAETERMASALAGSEFAAEFFTAAGKPGHDLALRTYLDKFVQESPTVLGYELLDADGKPIGSGRYGPAASSGWKAVTHEEGRRLFLLDREVVVEGRRVGYIRLVLGPELWSFLALPQGFPAGLVVLDSSGQPVFSAGLAEVRPDKAAEEGFGRLTDTEGRVWRFLAEPLAAGWSAVYLYRPAPWWTMAVNLGLWAAGLALAALVVWSVAALVGWMRRAERDADRAEEVVAATMAEMAKTLRSTADLAARVSETSREELEVLRRTVEAAPRTARDDGNREGGGEGEWEIL